MWKKQLNNCNTQSSRGKKLYDHMKYLFELLFWHKKKWELVWSQCWDPVRSLLRWWTKKILGVVKGECNHFNDSQQYLLSYQSISRASAQKGERREEERENWRSSTHISTPCAIDTINLLRFKHEHYQLFQLFFGGLGLEIGEKLKFLGFWTLLVLFFSSGHF